MRRRALVFPILVILVAVVATGIGLNGWSTGEFRERVTASADPRLLVGEPRPVRRDEWFVQSAWAIAQVQQGLPAVNRTFPFGMDATLPQDLPRADWSVAFRPHQWGFLVLPVDQAFAAKWWILLASLVLSVYLLGVVLLRRPLVAAVISVAFAFSPFFQWWFLAPTVWPVVWGAVTVTAIEVAARGAGRASRLALAAVSGFLTAVVGMGIYAPFIVPVVLVVVGWGIGRAVATGRMDGIRAAVTRMLPVVVAGTLGAAVVGAWLLERQRTVEAFLSTVYPGPRIVASGAGTPLDVAQTVADSFSQALGKDGVLGQNPSEGSTFFLAGLFLVPVVVVLLVRGRRRGERTPWEVVGVLAALLVVAAFFAVPHLDLLGRITFLDRVPASRLRIGLGFASLLLVLVVMERGRRTLRSRPVVIAAAASAVVYLASQAAIAVALSRIQPGQVATAWAWWAIAAVGAVAIALAPIRRAALPVAVALLAVSAGTGAWVNPLYRGVYDLRSTAVSAAVREEPVVPGRAWVAVGDDLAVGVVIESGVTAYNGFQGAPSARMWAQVDPDGRYAVQWNRLAQVGWEPGVGEPTVSNPYPDQIVATFDACSRFAQSHVSYVLSDRSALRRQACLSPVKTFDYRSGDLTLYRVTPLSGATQDGS